MNFKYLKEKKKLKFETFFFFNIIIIIIYFTYLLIFIGIYVVNISYELIVIEHSHHSIND